VASCRTDITGNETESSIMSEFSPEEIIAHRFTQSRRKGYDTLQVDGYLERLAVYVGHMQEQIARQQATERTALEMLQQAQIIADETVAAAQRDAETLRQHAMQGLENAKKDAQATVNAAQAEADRTLLTARVQAEAAIERAQAKVAELEAAGRARTKEFDMIVDESRASAAHTAGELRSAGARLVEMAEHFEFELATRGEEIGTSNAAIDLGEQRVEVP
jgi:DivIVA domain-containing protein